MPKLIFEKLLNDNHSINVSVYKPDGISSFWSWFTKKSKTGDLPKTVFDSSYKLKLDENDINMIKANSINFEKLNIAARNRKKFPKQNKIFFLPKTSLGSKEKDILNNFVIKNIIKQKPFPNGTKTFEQALKSTSTLSVKSTQSLKYIHKIKSQRSIVHSVASSRANSKGGNTAGGPRNVLLKSVPPAVLKSNLQNKVFLPIYVGKRKVDKEIREQKNKPSENTNNQGFDNNGSNMIPMLLTKIKSMEEQISDIETTTKRINEVVSRQQILKISTVKTEPGITEKSTGVDTRNLATHKVYPKNTNFRSKKSKTHPKKLKNKRKTNYGSGNSSKGVTKNKGPSVKTMNNSCDKTKIKEENINSSFFNNPDKFLGLHNFTIPTDISKKNLFQANPNIGCDMILQLFKALSEVSSSMNVGQTESVKKKTLDEINVVIPQTIPNFSKPTFDWKHRSLTSASDTPDEEVNKANKRSSNFVVKTNYSFPLENYIVKKESSHVKQMHLNQPKNVVHESFENESLEKESNHVKQIHVNQPENVTRGSFGNEIHNSHINLKEEDLDVEHKDNLEQISPEFRELFEENKDEIKKLPETLQSNQDLTEKCIDLEETKDSEYSSDVALETQIEPQTCKNSSVRLDVKNVNVSKTIKQCSTPAFYHAENEIYIEQPFNEMPGISMEPCKMCSVHVKQSGLSTDLIKPIENLSSRTTILCSNVKNDPKVSITILVEDHLKNEVNMKSNIILNTENTTDVYPKQKVTEVKLPVLKSIGGKGDSENNAKEDNLQQNISFISLNEMKDLSNTKTAVSSSSLSNKSENSFQMCKKDFYCDVNVPKSNVTEGVNLFFNSNRGTYINQEKRRAFEEQLFGDKVKNKISNNPNNTPLIRSCTELKHYSKPKRILSQTVILGRNSAETIIKTNRDNSPLNSRLKQNCMNSEIGGTLTTNIQKQIDMFLVDDDYGNFKQVEKDVDSNIEGEVVKKHEYLIVKNKHKISDTAYKEPNIFNNDISFTRNQNDLDPRISCMYGLTLNQEPILKELRSEITLQLNSIDQQSEKGDNITIQAHNENALNIARQKQEVVEAINSVENVPDREINSKNIPSDCLPIENSTFSTVCIQTDWSLVGITIEHFQSEAIIKIGNEGSKISVSTQTEDVVQETKISHKETESLPCMDFKVESRKFTCKKVNNKLEESYKQIMSRNDEFSAVTDETILSTPATTIQDTIETVRVTENENNVGVSFQRKPGTPIKLVENSSKGDRLHNMKEDLPIRGFENFHNCFVPCFHPLLEENVVFDAGDSFPNYQGLMSSKILSRTSSALSQTYHFSPYNKPSDKLTSKHYLPKTVSIVELNSTKNSSFCKVLKGTHSVEQTLLPNSNTHFGKHQNGNKLFGDTADPKMKLLQSDCVISKDCDQEGKFMNPRTNSGKFDTIDNFKKVTCLKDGTVSKSLSSLIYKASECSSISSRKRSTKHMTNYLSGFECGDIEKNQRSVLSLTVGSYLSSGNQR